MPKQNGFGFGTEHGLGRFKSRDGLAAAHDREPLTAVLHRVQKIREVPGSLGSADVRHVIRLSDTSLARPTPRSSRSRRQVDDGRRPAGRGRRLRPHRGKQGYRLGTASDRHGPASGNGWSSPHRPRRTCLAQPAGHAPARPPSGGHQKRPCLHDPPGLNLSRDRADQLGRGHRPTFRDESQDE